ncbi:MAG: cellulase family glycosylhydrolase [Flammeovirgaceae bacterium]|nr:cellulase family glycosylhydrolase [Flammeovirgaceae bacterium]
MRDITGLEIAKEMAPGVNLWNTLDASCWWLPVPHGLESEVCWQQPYTTPEMVASIAERGFKTLRIPVTWYNHMGPAPEYLIDEKWMDRVEEVANYAFDNNMYVIINIHHDDLKEDQLGSWLVTTYNKQDTVTDQIEKVWIQIATRFKDYGDYLIFETMNEPREVGSPHEWDSGSAEHRDVVNALNLAAVNAIRSTGGNNSSRFIMVPQVGGNMRAAIEDLVIPNDDPKIIVSVHNYDPYLFTLDDPGTNTWGTNAEKTELKNGIKLLGDHFVKNGRAVVVGEWGAFDKNNLEDRIVYYDEFARACQLNGLTPISWVYSFDRESLKWKYPELEDAILDAFDPNLVLGNLNIENNVGIYPNPASHTVKIKLTSLPSQIELYSVKGQQLLQLDSTKSQFEIDMSGFETGVYMLKMQLGEETTIRKIIVE